MKFKKDDLLDLCVTIELPDPTDPKLGGTLEHFVLIIRGEINETG